MTTAAVRETVNARRPVATDDLWCRCCSEREVEVFHTVDRVPVHNSLVLGTREEAVAFPTGRLVLGWCPACGFIQNTAFDPGLVRYGPGYEDSQAHSPRFVRFATEVGRSLLDRHPTGGGEILEIGCGKGDFLRILCGLDGDRGVGYDPVVDPSPDTVRDPALRWVAEPFDAETVEPGVRLVVCRHTLEHIDDVAAFVDDLVAFLARDPERVAYLEVPDTLRILREAAFWDLYYEHCSYFTRSSLSGLLARRGATILSSRVGYDGQYVQIELRSGGDPPAATPGHRPGPAAPDVDAAAIRRFRDRVGDLADWWRTDLERWSRSGSDVVLWGGGSKAVGFLTMAGASSNAVSRVVDISPAKHGRYLPGTGHRIVAPTELREAPPDVVILMNPVYRDEVAAEIASLGLAPAMVTA